MLIVETIGRIRREHLVQGKSIKEIARDLRISRNTVRKILRSGETSTTYEREVQPRPRLGRWKADLDRMLTTNVGNAVRERRKRCSDALLQWPRWKCLFCLRQRASSYRYVRR
jgi:hypothetical protein